MGNKYLENEKNAAEVEKDFRTWMASQPSRNGTPFKPETISSNANALKKVCTQMELAEYPEVRNLFSITDLKLFREIRDAIKSHPDYKAINKKHRSGCLNTAISIWYEKFLDERCNVSVTSEGLQEAYLRLSRKMLQYVSGSNRKENTVSSPYSLYVLLALASSATSGKTREEILKLLAPGCSLESLNTIIKDVQEGFAQKSKSCSLKSSNGICAADDFYSKISEDFKKLASAMYDAEIFKGGDDAVKVINSWVKKKTDGMIPQLLDGLPPAFKVCLMNAIAFDAKWEHKYEPEDIEKGEFYNVDRTVSIVDMLKSTEHDYVEDDNFTGFVRDYKGGRYALMALLPKKNSKKFMADAITKIDFAEYYKARQNIKTYVTMPEFKCETKKELTAFCTSLGLESIFTPEADFSSMTNDGNVMVSSILQKAVIDVSREGTKAAAVTAMCLMEGCLPFFEESKEVVLDRPFVYAVINKEYGGMPVFMGMVNQLKSVKTSY